MKKVAFICVHNSCRSQMAEALARVIGLEVLEAYSAGTETKPQINQDAVMVMKELGIDMEINQSSKLFSDIPEVDIVITMGCNVVCPMIKSSYREDWGLEDPSGKGLAEFRQTRNIIKNKVDSLVTRIKNNLL